MVGVRYKKVLDGQSGSELKRALRVRMLTFSDSDELIPVVKNQFYSIFPLASGFQVEI